MSLGTIEDVNKCIRNLLKKFDYQKRDLHQIHLKQLKELIKANAGIIDEFQDELFEHLSSKDSDKRVCIVLIIDYFFQRSHAFRQAVIKHLEEFLLNTVELDPLYNPLPGPPVAATMLKKETLAIFKLWVGKFVDGYPQLDKARTVLMASKMFDYSGVDGSTEVERARVDAERRKKDQADKKVIDATNSELESSKPHIEDAMIGAESVLAILVPDFRQFDTSLQSSSSSVVISPEVAAARISHSQARNLTVSISKKVVIERTKDNRELIQSFKDSKKLLNHNLKKVQHWHQKVVKHGATQQLLSELDRLEARLKIFLEKFQDITLSECREVIMPARQAVEEGHGSDSDDEDGFETVDIAVKDPEGFSGIVADKPLSPKIEPATRSSCLPKPKPKCRSPSPQPCSSKTVFPPTEKKMASPTKAVPKLPFGLDLKYWGQDVKPAEIQKNNQDDHPFWRAPDHESPQTESQEVYNCRLITFVTDMPKITRSCRAPLPSGRLCPRMDRYKCPLHGSIIDRDEQGRPTNKSQKPSSPTAYERSAAAVAQRYEEAQEDDYWKELEQQTGGKFSADIAKKARERAKGKRGSVVKKREKSAHQKTRDRLKTKLLNRRTIKRIGETFDQIQKAKAERKFAHQFNY